MFDTTASKEHRYRQSNKNTAKRYKRKHDDRVGSYDRSKFDNFTLSYELVPA